ncbi:hypothetical protein PG995_005610 [Apiospora arundinis]
MTRDFLLFMDDLIPEQRQKQTVNSPEWNNNDHVKYLYPDNADEPPRGCPGRADHRCDWIDINNTSRRIRRLGRESFFRVKVLALATSDLPTTKAKTTILTTTLTPLPPPNFALFGGDPSKMPPALMLTRKQRREQSQKEQTQMEQSQEQNQHSDPYKAADKSWDGVELVLPHIQHAVLLNPNDFTPNWYLKLPAILAASLPRLRRCTLLYYFDKAAADPVSNARSQDHVDEEVRSATAALQLARPAPHEMQNLMRGIGMSPDVKMEEALMDRPPQTWELHQESMEKYIYPILRIRARVKARIAKESETNHCS